MSLSDVLDFEAFNLKDMWKKVKKDPERLLIGAVDPWSTKMWNGITGSNYEPIVDQMGGAYGGHTISAFGNQTGGAYGRAQDAGIDTMAGAQVQDLAHVIAAMYAGGYGADKLGGMVGGQSGGGASSQWDWMNRIPKGQGNTQNRAARERQLYESQDLLEAIMIASAMSNDWGNYG